MILFILILLSSTQLGICVNPYVIPNIRVNWHKAHEFCKYNGMELASVTDWATHKKLTEFVAQELNCSTWCAVWIGANDLGDEGSFTWVGTGRRVVFDNWKPNQPSNSNGDQEEHCVEILYHPRGGFNWQWNDGVCKHEKYFVCEKVYNCEIQEF
ncbi:perlucin-like [Armigeres subalbatus]|uniref:perlucin-like n=1 Tax=Armigeres subalbatus TaxID=124917 RepID=UPI002ED32657